MGLSLPCWSASIDITIIFNGLIFLGHTVKNGMDFIEVTLSECLRWIWLVTIFFIMLLIWMSWRLLIMLFAVFLLL